MMTEPQEQLGLYLHLARASEQRLRPMVRDKFLVLAGVCACELALDQIAAYCRHKVLENNPGHLLRKYREFADAIGDESFETYLKQLQRAYPLEKSEFMLQSLGIDLGNERAAYYSDHEYAAVLLGTTPEKLDELFKPGVAAEAPSDKPAVHPHSNGSTTSALDDPDDGSLDLFSDRKSTDSGSTDDFRTALSAAPSLPLNPVRLDSSDPSDDGLALDALSGEDLGVGGAADVTAEALDDAVLNIASTGADEPPPAASLKTPIQADTPAKTDKSAAAKPPLAEDSFDATMNDLTRTVERLEKPALSLDEDEDDDEVEIEDADEAVTDDVESALDEEPVGEDDTERSQIGRANSEEDAPLPDDPLQDADPLAESSPISLLDAETAEKLEEDAPANPPAPPVVDPFEQKRRPGSVLFEQPVKSGAPPTVKIVDAPTVLNGPAVNAPETPAKQDADAAAEDEHALFGEPASEVPAHEADSWFSQKIETPDEPTQFYKGPLISATELAAAAAGHLPGTDLESSKSAEIPRAEPEDTGSIFDSPGEVHDQHQTMPDQIEIAMQEQARDAATQAESTAVARDEEVESMLITGAFGGESLSPSKADLQAMQAAAPADPAPTEAEVDLAPTEAEAESEIAAIEQSRVEEPIAEDSEIEEPTAEEPTAEEPIAEAEPAPQAPAHKPVLEDDEENVLGGSTPRDQEIVPRYSFVGSLPITQHTTFETLNASLSSGESPLLNLFVRADTRASLEQIENELTQIEHPDLNVRLQATVGTISEADVDFADVLNAIIIGYNVTPDPNTIPLAKRRGVQIRQYNSIQQISDDLRNALSGRLPPMSQSTPAAAPVVSAPMVAAVASVMEESVIEESVVEESVIKESVIEEPVIEEPAPVATSPTKVVPVLESPPKPAVRPVLHEDLPPPKPAAHLHEPPAPAPLEVPTPAESAGSTSILMIAVGAAAFLAAFAAFLFVLGLMQQ